jgi:hypothetical protein
MYMTSDPKEVDYYLRLRNEIKDFARDNYFHAKHIVGMFVKQYIHIFVSYTTHLPSIYRNKGEMTS